MFRTILNNNRYCFHDGFDNWEDAIRASVQPLIKEGIATEQYCEDIINSINTHGPYIVIAPNICIPHAQQGKGVNDTAISFMKTNKPVKFSENEEHWAQLFFVLASTDNEKHLNNLSKLVEFLGDEDVVDILSNATCFEDLIHSIEEGKITI